MIIFTHRHIIYIYDYLIIWSVILKNTYTNISLNKHRELLFMESGCSRLETNGILYINYVSI